MVGAHEAYLVTERSASVKLSLISRFRFTLRLPITLLIYLLLASCSSKESDLGAGNQGSEDEKDSGRRKRFYSTDFPAMESPISERGKWINGGTTGRDWGNVQTIPGLAFGTNVSGAPPYDDSTAVLAGAWGSNQMAQATVYTVNQTPAVAQEVELRLRTTITAHRITGYEFVYRATSDGSQYIGIVRWNGALNDFSELTRKSCTDRGPGLHNGDTVMATAIGDTLTLYINGTKYCQTNESTYPDGSPGIGFWNWGGTVGDGRNFGFTNFTAQDGL